MTKSGLEETLSALEEQTEELLAQFKKDMLLEIERKGSEQRWGGAC